MRDRLRALHSAGVDRRQYRKASRRKRPATTGCASRRQLFGEVIFDAAEPNLMAPAPVRRRRKAMTLSCTERWSTSRTLDRESAGCGTR